MSWSERLPPAFAAPAAGSHRDRTAGAPARRPGRAAYLIALIAAGWIAGCGFHLRGDVTYAFSTLYVSSPANLPFTGELKHALAVGGMTMTSSAAAAQAILDVSGVTDDKQVLSLSGGGRAREYLLTKRVTVALHDASGRDWMPAAEVVVRRSYTFNESEVLAREAEEARLFKEMQTDAVQQVVRRLQSAKRPEQ
jgi:LPS-assembly lipoprotein